MTEQSAIVYEQRGFYYVRAYVQTEVGLLLEDGPCTALAVDVPAHRLGEAAREALARSGRIVPHPTEWKSADLDNPILEAAGIKRWATFCKQARCVNIDSLDGVFILTPTENMGRSEFDGLLEQTVRLPAGADAAAVGQGIREALGACR